MSDWPDSGSFTSPASMHPFHPMCGTSGGLLAAATAQASIIWPVANYAIYIPFVNVAKDATAYQMGVLNGTIVSGNVDVGIYDRLGNKLVSKGTTVQAGVSAIQAFDITDTPLPFGLIYMAVSIDNITATATRISTIPAQALGAMGVLAQSVFPLPATATFVQPTQPYLPWLMISTRSVL